MRGTFGLGPLVTLTRLSNEPAVRRDDSWWDTAVRASIPRNAALLDYLSRTQEAAPAVS